MIAADFDRLPLPEQRRLVAAELRRIEAGGEPAESRGGLCAAIWIAFGKSEAAYGICFTAVGRLYGHTNLFNEPGLSKGNFGPARRALARRVAGVLEAQSDG